MNFFDDAVTAARYSRYRPKVHGLALQWLREALPMQTRFRRALDVGTGTGDSLRPLMVIADHAEGIDASPAMVEQARAAGLNARVCRMEENTHGDFDLLSLCMALHWLPPETALTQLKRASADRSVWLVYNFWLAGHEVDRRLDDWLRIDYPRLLPPPARGPSTLLPITDPELSTLRCGTGHTQVAFSRGTLIGYLTTQSNVAAAQSRGATYAQVMRFLEDNVPRFTDSDAFRYEFSYSVLQFTRSSSQ